MSLPRLVATDLDGTLVRSDGTISARTREVLAAVEARGVPVVFVTGRPLRWAAEVFDHVGDHGLAVVSNGALVWDVGADRPRLRREIDPATVLRVCAELRAAVPGSAFAVETLDGIGLEPEFLERHPVPEGARRAPLEELVTEPVVKLLARHEELGPQDYWDAAEAAIGDQVTITWSSSSTLLEISAPASPRPPRWPCSRSGSGSTRPTSWPSATCPTTCRCWPGPVRRTPWPTPTRACSTPSTSWRRATTRTAWPQVLAGIFDL